MSGGTRTMGSLEFFHKGEWGSICSEFDINWNVEASKAACRELGFPGFVKFRRRNILRQGIVWNGKMQCFGNERSVSECLNITEASKECNHYLDVNLQCQAGRLKDHSHRRSKISSALFLLV